MRHLSIFPALIAIGLVLASCSSHHSQHASRNPFAGKGSPLYPGTGPIPMGGGHYQLGKPYEVAGWWFTPKEQPDYDKQGTASWYGEAFHRRMTSNGEWFDMNRLTAAHASLPLPSYVKVTNIENGRTVVVRVNDRGPFVGTRVIDMSKRAATALGYKGQGTAPVRVQYIGPAPLDDNGTHLAAMNDELRRGTPLRRMIAAASGGRGKVQVAVVETTPEPMEPDTVVYQEPEQDVAAAEPAERQTIAYQDPARDAEPVDSYYVQVGSFADPDNAERAREQLSSTWPVQVVELSGSGGTIYRVRLGPIADRPDADTAVEDAVALGHLDARVIVEHSMQAAL
jgi:rare lipoprotein A